VPKPYPTRPYQTLPNPKPSKVLQPDEVARVVLLTHRIAKAIGLTPPGGHSAAEPTQPYQTLPNPKKSSSHDKRKTQSFLSAYSHTTSAEPWVSHHCQAHHRGVKVPRALPNPTKPY
jgi:hypothetical protein